MRINSQPEIVVPRSRQDVSPASVETNSGIWLLTTEDLSHSTTCHVVATHATNESQAQLAA